MDTRYWSLDTGKSFSFKKYQASSILHPVSARFLKISFSIFLIGLMVFINLESHALDWDFEGQLSGWTIESEINDHWENSTGLRYIPELNISHELNNDKVLDSEISANMFTASGSDPYMDDTDIDLYRADIRYTTIHTETRIGLQKINFGPAVILRPLKWFDRLNPTDPLNLTEGVYALRFRYDTLNNANYWAWLLYGNDDPKGFEIMPSTSDNLEAGGRIQHPFLSGDMAFTFHTRKVNGSQFNIPEFRENRYALDGRWDVGIGLWFESVFQEQKTELLPFKWTKRFTLGADYTFNIGSGLYLLMEHMSTAISDKILKWDKNYHTSAFQMSCSIGILDSISAIGYYSWEQSRYYQHLSWMRTYDNFIFNVNLFNYPETTLDNSGVNQNVITDGRGVQIMVIFNH